MKNIRRIALMLLMSTAMLTAAGQSKRDVRFAKCAAQDGIVEVKLAELAVDKAVTPEVRAHAQHMVDDHKRSNKELKALAAKKNIELPNSMTNKQQRNYEKFASLDGKKFDKKYARVMKSHHKKGVCMFKKQAKKGDDAELTSWASNKVPTLESHLDTWKDVAKNLRKDDSGSMTYR